MFKLLKLAKVPIATFTFKGLNASIKQIASTVYS